MAKKQKKIVPRKGPKLPPLPKRARRRPARRRY